MLAGCAAGMVRERRYAGPLAGCGLGGTSTLTTLPGRAGTAGSFAFAPGDGSLILRGTMAGDGRLDGTLNTQPAGKPPHLLRLAGQAAQTTAELVYMTPSCKATGTLHRIMPTLMP